MAQRSSKLAFICLTVSGSADVGEGGCQSMSGGPFVPVPLGSLALVRVLDIVDFSARFSEEAEASMTIPNAFRL